jgi:adenosylhomocysteine nucleosidase
MNRCWILLVWIGIGIGCASAPPESARGSRPGPFIAVMAAYPPELEANASVLGEESTRGATWRIDGIVFQHLRFAGHDLLLFPSGVSMVNAAMNTQKALDHFRISHVFFAGIAGGINPERHIGDVVIPERWYHHSEAAYLNPRPDGQGYVLPDYFKPRLENFGFMFPDSVEVIREGMDKPESRESFEADAQLLAVARKAVTHVPPLRLGTRQAQVSVGGNGISGPVFLDNREYRRWAFRVWQADCLDMESTAIAQVCWANRTPFLIVRSLSDLAGGQEGVNDADRTERPVSRHASWVLREILRALPATP